MNDDDDEYEENAVARVQQSQMRLKLSLIDKLALESLVDERDAPAIVSWVEASATALAGDDREAARLRLIGRAVATERARLLVLEALLDQNLAAGSWRVVREIKSVIGETTRSLCALLREHAAACHARHNVVVAVAHVDSINVGSEK